MNTQTQLNVGIYTQLLGEVTCKNGNFLTSTTTNGTESLNMVGVSGVLVAKNTFYKEGVAEKQSIFAGSIAMKGKDSAEFLAIKAFGKDADLLNKLSQNKARVALSGNLMYESFEKKDGTQGAKCILVAQSICATEQANPRCRAFVRRGIACDSTGTAFGENQTAVGNLVGTISKIANITTTTGKTVVKITLTGTAPVDAMGAFGAGNYDKGTQYSVTEIAVDCWGNYGIALERLLSEGDVVVVSGYGLTNYEGTYSITARSVLKCGEVPATPVATTPVVATPVAPVVEEDAYAPLDDDDKDLPF